MSALDEATWTVDEMHGAIAAAIRKHDFEAVAAWLKLMALWYPREAQETFDALRAVLSSLRRAP